MKYRVNFQAPLDSELHGAVQVNTGTSAQRHVRRWPSKAHREWREEQQKALIMAAWSEWVQADFSWSLFDADELGDCSGTRKPSKDVPKSRAYGLGHTCTFADSFWPSLLRTWPTASLKAAEHPLGKRCSFAMLRLTPMSSHCTPEWQILRETWNQGGLAGRSELVAAYRIQNRGLIHGFAAMRQAMLARLSSEDFDDGIGREGNLSVRLLWHGTRKVSSMLDVCSDGFDRAQAKVCAFGQGCYFATSATYSDKYACSVKVPCESPHRKFRAMILAAVLIGETVQGSTNMYPAPTKPHSRSGERYDNACDNMSSPSIFVTFKDCQALPAYVVVYEMKS
jgi:hypothetical protein